MSLHQEEQQLTNEESYLKNGRPLNVFKLGFSDPKLEELYRLSALKERRGGLQYFLVSAVLYDFYTIGLPDSHTLVRIPVGVGLAVNLALLAWSEWATKPRSDGLWQRSVPYLAWLVSSAQLIGPLFLKDGHDVTPRDNFGWLLMLVYLHFATLPLRLSLCLGLAVATTAAYLGSVYGLSNLDVSVNVIQLCDIVQCVTVCHSRTLLYASQHSQRCNGHSNLRSTHGHAVLLRRHPRRRELPAVRVPAASRLPRDQVQPRGPDDDRGAVDGAGASAAERAARARRRDDAPGSRRLHGHPVQEDLHVAARERLDTVRRHRGLHRDLVNLLRQRARQDTERAVRQVRSAEREVRYTSSCASRSWATATTASAARPRRGPTTRCCASTWACRWSRPSSTCSRRPRARWTCAWAYTPGRCSPGCWASASGSSTSTARTWSWPTRWRAAAEPDKHI
ncbi:unnamed protein product [Trichogramma brassicae]|uniref:Adenylate cyclase N-terminal domain-containing protein n=1 Tax=Trichogramma brassicae TaxID=86971 RepID=A0A6H5J9B5_9HYME|nr:unnamed protein product [Trichogramma brassicae]